MVAISLSKDGGVRRFRLGVAWDRKKVKQTKVQTLGSRFGIKIGKDEKDIDLDAMAVLCRDGAPKRLLVGFNMDPCRNGSALHSGDNTTGAGDGDDETMDFNLDAIPAWVTEIVGLVSAYKVGTSFDSAQNVSMNIYDTTGSQTVLRDELMPTLGRKDTAHAMVVVRRVGTSDDWTLTPVDIGRKINQDDENAVLSFAQSVLNSTAR